jgi:hypothetical protein
MVGVRRYKLSRHLHCTGEDGATASNEVKELSPAKIVEKVSTTLLKSADPVV